MRAVVGAGRVRTRPRAGHPDLHRAGWRALGRPDPVFFRRPGSCGSGRRRTRPARRRRRSSGPAERRRRASRPGPGRRRHSALAASAGTTCAPRNVVSAVNSRGDGQAAALGLDVQPVTGLALERRHARAAAARRRAGPGCAAARRRRRLGWPRPWCGCRRPRTAHRSYARRTRPSGRRRRPGGRGNRRSRAGRPARRRRCDRPRRERIGRADPRDPAAVGDQR